MRRVLLMLLLSLSGSATAACVLDAITLQDTPLVYVAFKPVAETRTLTLTVRCDRALDRYGLRLAGSVQAAPGGWEAELRPRRGGGVGLRITLGGAAEMFGPGVSFGGEDAALASSAPDGPRTYTHTLTLRAGTDQWVPGGEYMSDLRVVLRDL